MRICEVCGAKEGEPHYDGCADAPSRAAVLPQGGHDPTRCDDEPGGSLNSRSPEVVAWTDEHGLQQLKHQGMTTVLSHATASGKDIALCVATPSRAAGTEAVQAGDRLVLDAMLGELLRHDADESHPRIKALERAIAALASPPSVAVAQEAVTSVAKVLPKEPTQTMLDAAHKQLPPRLKYLGFDHFRASYRIMWETAPAHPEAAKDAERLEWYANTPYHLRPMEMVNGKWRFAADDLNGPHYATLREAIDAALASSKFQEKTA
jgi:hypothetical protein